VQGNAPSPAAAGVATRVLAQLLKMRELILCPGEFELPGGRRDGEPEIHYVEPAVDLKRRGDGAFPMERLDPGRRLLYVSLGSQSYQTGRERAPSASSAPSPPPSTAASTGRWSSPPAA
jgi:hypothetical protein